MEAETANYNWARGLSSAPPGWTTPHGNDAGSFIARSMALHHLEAPPDSVTSSRLKTWSGLTLTTSSASDFPAGAVSQVRHLPSWMSPVSTVALCHFRSVEMRTTPGRSGIRSKARERRMSCRSSDRTTPPVSSSTTVLSPSLQAPWASTARSAPRPSNQSNPGRPARAKEPPGVLTHSVPPNARVAASRQSAAVWCFGSWRRSAETPLRGKGSWKGRCVAGSIESYLFRRVRLVGVEQDIDLPAILHRHPEGVNRADRRAGGRSAECPPSPRTLR